MEEKETDLKLLAKKIMYEKQKEWRKKNPEKAKAITERYWLKKAKQYLESEVKENEDKQK